MWHHHTFSQNTFLVLSKQQLLNLFWILLSKPKFWIMKFLNLFYFFKIIFRKTWDVSPKWSTMPSNTRYVASKKVCPSFRIILVDLNLIVGTNHNKILMQVCSASCSSLIASSPRVWVNYFILWKVFEVSEIIASKTRFVRTYALL